MTKWLTKRGDVWHYRFRVGGVDYMGSTEATDLSTAQLVLDDLRRQCVLGDHGLRKAPSLKVVAESWVALKGPGVSPSHLRAAKQSIVALQPLLGLPLNQITHGRVEGWRSDYQQTHAVASANLALRYLKLFLNFAREDRLIREMPCKIREGREQERERPVVALPHDYLDRIYTGHRNPQVPAAVTFCLMLGLRESEVLQASWPQIQNGIFIVSGRTKSKRIRRIPIPDEVRLALGWMLAAQHHGPAQLPTIGLIFPGTRGARHKQGWLRQALDRGGVGHIGQHRLRATFITLHLRKGTQLKEVQKMVGHSDPRTTLKYQEVRLEDQAKAQDDLWRRA